MPEEKPQPQAPYYPQTNPQPPPAGANAGGAPAVAAGPASLVQDSSYFNHKF